MKIIIPGNPEPQLRPRATRMGKGIRLYDPKKTTDYKHHVRMNASNQWKLGALVGAIKVTLTIYRKIQKSTTKRDLPLKKSGSIRPTVKPDVDNYTKGILDALNGVAWSDDSQVVTLIAHKYYSDEPRVEIEIEELEVIK